jgi:epoxyqueuosine reductase
MLGVRPRSQLRDSAGSAPDFPARSAHRVGGGFAANKWFACRIGVPSWTGSGKGLARRGIAVENTQTHRAPFVMSLLRSSIQEAARNGLNLFGLVDAKRFDSCQPREQRCCALRHDCGTIVVLGSAGRQHWLGFTNQRQMTTPVTADEQVDELLAAGVRDLVAFFARHGLVAKVVDARKPTINFGRLAEAAGFGIVSPVSGMLLHPEFGPWLRVRAAVLLPGMPFGPIPDASIADRFRPCCNCPKPCVSACPGAVHDGVGTSDRARCADHRHRGGCETGCHSRMACPIGAEHADQAAPHAHAHTIARRTMQRWYGLGWWRIVPRILRGGPQV